MNQTPTPIRAIGKAYCRHCSFCNEEVYCITGPEPEYLAEGFANLRPFNGLQFHGACHNCHWRGAFTAELVNLLGTEIYEPYSLTAMLYEPKAWLTRHIEGDQSTKILADLEYKDANVLLKVGNTQYEYPIADPISFPDKLIRHLKLLCEADAWSLVSKSKSLAASADSPDN